jgi:hypothetical protein
MAPQAKIKLLPGGFFAAIGVILLVVGSLIALSRRSFLDRAMQADGVVVRLNAGGSHPQVTFTAANGQTVSYPQGGLIWGYKEGDRVRVLYGADDPERTACIDAFGALWFVPVMLGFLGLAQVAAGLFAVFRPHDALRGPLNPRNS